jgi:hypothetical protein
MSAAKFEKLIDLLINEDQEKAEQLFHEIVVEKSREIYESIMDEDQTQGFLDEIESEQEGMDGMMEDDEEFMDTEVEDDDISVDGDDEMDADAEFSDGEDGEEDMDIEMAADDAVTKDDIMDLSDKLDQLMADFEAEFGSEEEEEGEEEEEAGEEEEEEGESMMEAVELKKVQAPKHGDNGANSKSPVVANSGAKGPVGSVVKPVKFSGDSESVPTSAKSPSNAYTKGESTSGEKYQNSPGGASGVKGGKGESAPKPKHEDHKAKSPVAESKRVLKKRI